MSKVSEHFDRLEFSCSCQCGFSAVDVDLLAILEDVRSYFGVPVNITSACRCTNHNNSIGGALGSYHVKGMAADIQVRGVDPDYVADYIESNHPTKLGVGRYDSFTHLDVRAIKARWDKRKNL